MQIGYNNDVEYRDKTFHIQTEDHGEPAAAIETQIFQGGAILDTSIISYAKVLEETDDVDERIARIRALMQGNHKKLYKNLFAGQYDELVGLEPVGDVEIEISEDDFVPSQEAVPAAALEVERGNLDALAGAEPEGEHVGLAELQAQLNADAEKADAATSGGRPVPSRPSTSKSAPNLTISADIATTQQMSTLEPASRNGSPVAEYPKTGASAWRGCERPPQELDIVNLVEEFAGG